MELSYFKKQYLTALRDFFIVIISLGSPFIVHWLFMQYETRLHRHELP